MNKISETQSISNPISYFDQEMSQPDIFGFLGGSASVFTSRSPSKETANEDSAAIVPFDDSSGVLVVADGMGGHAAGEVASKIAIREIISAIQKVRDAGALLRTGIISGFENANDAILSLGTGGGTTLAVVELSEGMARTYHAGDSIILIFSSRGTVKLETVSHSLVGLGVESGLLDADEAANHEDRHLILNAIGSADMRIEIGSPVKLAKRDTIVVASDGLSDNLQTEEIVELTRCGRLDRAAINLTQRCREHMNGDSENAKPDDLTVVCFRQTPCIATNKDGR